MGEAERAWLHVGVGEEKAEVGPTLWISKNHEAGFWSALQLQGRTWNPNSNFLNFFFFNQKKI